LFTTASMRPNRASPASMAARIVSGFSTSSAVTKVPGSSWGVRMVAMTFQPRAANSSAVALPKPDEAPVMRTVFFMGAPPVETVR
jgi:hypothetical protein